MTGEQAKVFHDAMDAAGIKVYEYDTDLCSHFYNDGVHSIVKPDYDNGMMVAFRSIDFGGRPKRYEKNIQVVVSTFEDIHEVRCCGDYDQISKFIESIGSISLSDDEMKILLDIDKANYELIPETGDYVSRFRYLSAKEYAKLTPEEKAEYDEAKGKYEEEKKNYIGQNVAASITL